MPGWSIRSRAPQGLPRNANALETVQRDADVLRTVLEDAAHFPGGHAEGLVSAASEADVAQALAGRTPVLPIGAQSSLTGGATPMGEIVLATARLDRILEIRRRNGARRRPA